MTSFVRNVVSHLMITMTTKNVGLRDKKMVEVIDHRAELLFIKSAVWDFAEYVGVHYPEIVEEFNHSQKG
jgi:hypothetical protein